MKHIKHITHTLNQTILTSVIGITKSEKTPSTGNTKTINTPNVDDIRTNTVADKPLKDSTTDFQLPQNASLHSINTDSNINATYSKVNHPPEKTSQLHL